MTNNEPSAAVKAALEEAARERAAHSSPSTSESSSAVKAALEEAARERAVRAQSVPSPVSGASPAVLAALEEAARERVSLAPPPPSSLRSSVIPQRPGSAPSPLPQGDRSTLPPSVRPPPGSSPRASVSQIPDIPSVRASTIPKHVPKVSIAAASAPRVTGIEALQKRLEQEQAARQKSDESNMQLRLELNDSKKEVSALKREVSKLERDIKQLERDISRFERLKK